MDRLRQDDEISINIDKKYSPGLRQRIKKTIKNVKARIRLNILIKDWHDVENLKTLHKFCRAFNCRDVLITSGSKGAQDREIALSSVPVIYKHLLNKKLGIGLINIDPCYFSTKTCLDNITALFIEPTNTCNLSCSFCRTGRGERKRPGTLLTFKRFREIVDQFRVLPNRVELLGRGEPFLNPELFKMIRYLKKNKSAPCVSTSTNGHFLGNDQVRRMLESGLDILTISMDSLKKTTYERMRRGGNFNLVLNSLKLLSSLKHRGMKRPVVILQFIITKWNEGEIESIKKTVPKLGFETEFRSISSDDHGILPFKISLRRNEGKRGRNLRAVDFCPAPWKQMAISCEGIVTMCPKSLNPGHFDMEASHLALGDIEKASLESIWNSSRYQALRKQMLENKHAVGCPVRCPNPDFSLNKKILAMSGHNA